MYTSCLNSYPSAEGARMGDVASINLPRYVVFGMFSGDNRSQHNGKIQPNLSWPFSYPLFSEAHKGMEEGGKRDQTNMTVLFIQKIKILIIHFYFPAQVPMNHPA